MAVSTRNFWSIFFVILCFTYQEAVVARDANFDATLLEPKDSENEDYLVPKTWMCADNGDIAISPASIEIMHGYDGIVNPARYSDPVGWGRQNYILGAWKEENRRNFYNTNSNNDRTWSADFFATDRHRLMSRSGYDLLIPASKHYTIDELGAISLGMVDAPYSELYKRSPYIPSVLSYSPEEANNFREHTAKSFWARKDDPAKGIGLITTKNNRWLRLVDTVGNSFFANTVPLEEKVLCTALPNWEKIYYKGVRAENGMYLKQVEAIYVMDESGRTLPPIFRVSLMALATYANPKYGKKPPSPKL